MVPDISKGDRVRGLLEYLYGPGRRDEHTDPHIVASWDGFTPDPGRHPGVTLDHVADALDLHVAQRRRSGRRPPEGYVWHCPVRTDPGDRPLTDDEWADVARRIVGAVGLAEDGDPGGCRWIAVRHAEDHIHIVVTRVRANLTVGTVHRERSKAQAECRQIEKDLGLRQLNPGDGTAAPRPSSAEQFKAERTGTALTPREELHAAVRLAATGAATEREFFARLRRAGLVVKERTAPSGDVIGYAVGKIGDRNKDGDQVWFSGSTLAADLSLPRLRRRFDGADPTVLDAGAVGAEDTAQGTTRRPGGRRPAPRPSRAGRAHLTAADALDQAHDILDTGLHDARVPAPDFPSGPNRAQAAASDRAAAAGAAGIHEVLEALAEVQHEPLLRGQLKEAARTYERAARSQIRAANADQRALRRAARDILRAGQARPEDGGALGTVLSTLVVAVIAAGRWHAAQGHRQQAAAARQAADQLWNAYRQSAPVARLAAAARNLPADVRHQHTASALRALPDTLHHKISPTGMDLLTATLAQAAHAGHDPEALLHQAVSSRELDTATDPAHVTAWRIRRLAELPAPGSTHAPIQPARHRSQAAAANGAAAQAATDMDVRRRS